MKSLSVSRSRLEPREGVQPFLLARWPSSISVKPANAQNTAATNRPKRQGKQAGSSDTGKSNNRERVTQPAIFKRLSISKGFRSFRHWELHNAITSTGS